MAEYALREATVADARTLAEYRRLMFTAMGWVAPGQGDDLVSAMERYLEREIPTGQVRGWIVDCDGQPVAGGIIVLQVPAPMPGFVQGEALAAIQNIWTDPEHRRRGLAGKIVRAMIAWCREHGVRRLFLNATEDGRGVYTALGFRPSTTAMTLTLEAGPCGCSAMRPPAKQDTPPATKAAAVLTSQVIDEMTPTRQ